MKDWLRFSVAFWHTFRGTGGDPFGAATKFWPWEEGTNSLAMAKRRMRANFEFLKKLGVERWCFHDRDIAPDGKTLGESNLNLDEALALANEKSRIRGQHHVSFDQLCYWNRTACVLCGQLCYWNNNLTRQPIQLAWLQLSRALHGWMPNHHAILACAFVEKDYEKATVVTSRVLQALVDCRHKCLDHLAKCCAIQLCSARAHTYAYYFSIIKSCIWDLFSTWGLL